MKHKVFVAIATVKVFLSSAFYTGYIKLWVVYGVFCSAYFLKLCSADKVVAPLAVLCGISIFMNNVQGSFLDEMKTLFKKLNL